MSYYDFLSQYDEETKTFTLQRNSGLFANLNWLIYHIVCLEFENKKVENIILMLEEYFESTNVYPKLFKKTDVEIDYSTITEEEKNSFKNRELTYYGMGGSIEDFPFHITTPIIKKFFQPIVEIENYYNFLLKENQIITEQIIFVWARQTDKINEVVLPKLTNYLEVLNNLSLSPKEIILQTDDKNLYLEFVKKTDFKRINEIPFANNDEGFHTRMCTISDEQFKIRFGITKLQHLYQMIIISLLAKDCSYSIIYPGNATTYIPILKGSNKNLYLFR
jgi:hypothetical protein